MRTARSAVSIVAGLAGSRPSPAALHAGRRLRRAGTPSSRMPSASGTAARAPSDGATPAPPLPRERPTVPCQPAAGAADSPARGGVESAASSRPIMAPDTSGLPLELWRGLDLKTLEELLAGLELPPRSPALHQLWRRMLLSSATPPAGAPNDEHFVALAPGGALSLRVARRHGRRCSRTDSGARPDRADAARPARHRPRPARGGLPDDQGAGRAELGPARPPQGRDAAAGRLLRRGRRRCSRRRPRRRARPRGGHRGRAAAWRCWRPSPPATSRGSPCPSACCCSTTGSWSCWGPVDAHADLRQGRAGAAGHARRRSPRRTRACRSPLPRRRCGSTPCRPQAVAEAVSPPVPVRQPAAADPAAPGTRSAVAARAVLPGRRGGARAGTARALPAGHHRRCPPIRLVPADGARRGTAAGGPAALAGACAVRRDGRRDRAGRRRVRPGAAVGGERGPVATGWR